MEATKKVHNLQRRPRRSGKNARSKHLRPMPRWLAIGAATGLGVAGSIGMANGRHRAVALRWALAGAAAAATGLVLGSLEVRRPRLEQVEVPIAGLPAAFDGLRIAQIGDFHYRPDYRRNNVRQARAWIAEASPDLIVLTGDFVDREADLPLLVEELRGMSAPLGVFAVLGNHDYWFDPARVDEALEGLGYTLLVNEHRVLERGGARLVLAGVDDPWYGDADLDAALAGSPAEAPIVLLSHTPDFVDHARRASVALQLSGHSHAGHLALPLLGPALLPWGAWSYHRGLYCCGETWLYVNRGLGGRPLRLNAPPELTLLRLTAAAASVG